MDVFAYFLILLVALGIYWFGHFMGVHSTGAYDDMECDIYVQSLRTGRKYHASRYRLSNRGPEIYIYNYAPGEFVWHSVWHFESASQIVAYLMPDYAREHYKISKMPSNNDFTRKSREEKWNNKNLKNQKSDHSLDKSN